MGKEASSKLFKVLKQSKEKSEQFFDVLLKNLQEMEQFEKDKNRKFRLK